MTTLPSIVGQSDSYHYSNVLAGIELMHMICKGPENSVDIAAVSQYTSFFAGHLLVNSPALACAIKDRGKSPLEFSDAAWLE